MSSRGHLGGRAGRRRYVRRWAAAGAWRRRWLALAALPRSLAGCGLGAGTAPTRRAAGRHARLRRADRALAASAPTVHGQETVMSLLMRNATVTHPLRRRLRGERRRPLRRPRRRAAGRLVLLRQRRRGAQGRGRDERASRRSHLVGPARLEPDRGRARRRRLLPRAVPERDRRQAAAGARRMRRADGAPCRTVTARLRAPACRPRSPRSGPPARSPNRCACSSAVVAGERRSRQRGDSNAAPRASGVYARSAANGRTLTLLDERARRCARSTGSAG